MSEKEFKEYGFTKARVRAKGTRGPTRHKLTSFKHITKVPKQVMSEIERIIKLQRCTEEGVDVNEETNYNDWRDDTDVSVIKKYLEDNFGEVYRARISVMPPGHELFWHIDTDTSVLCRMQLAIRAEGSEFQFRNRIEGERSLVMENGNAYFVNTGWSHRVVNKDNWRVVLIFGIEYNNIPNKEQLHIS